MLQKTNKNKMLELLKRTRATSNYLSHIIKQSDGYQIDWKGTESNLMASKIERIRKYMDSLELLLKEEKPVTLTSEEL